MSSGIKTKSDLENSYVGTTNAHLSRTVFTWKIDAFSHRNASTTSPTFTDDEKNELYLNLNPNVDQCLDLEIQPSKLPQNQLDVKYKFWLINSQGEKCLVADDFGKLTFYGIRRSCLPVGLITIPKIISRAELLKPSNGYIVEDTLTIQCEITRIVHDVKHLETLAGPTQVEITAKAMEDFGGLLKSGSLADVNLIVGGKSIPAHTQILAARSSVFAGIFKQDSKENQVEIPGDVSLESFETLLDFLYTCKVPKLGNVKSTKELLFAADKYDCGQLKSICEEYLLVNSLNAVKLGESTGKGISGQDGQQKEETWLSGDEFLALMEEAKKKASKK